MVLHPDSRNPRVADPKPGSVLTVQYLVERRQEVAVVAQVVAVVVDVDLVHGDVRKVLHVELLCGSTECGECGTSLFLQGDDPPIDFKTKVPLCPGQARPDHNGTFALKSTRGFAQPDLHNLLCHPVCIL